MNDLGLDRFTKNMSYEIGEDGVRFKFFGIPYFLSVEDLKSVILNLNRIHERILMMKKEKEDLQGRKNEICRSD